MSSSDGLRSLTPQHERQFHRASRAPGRRLQRDSRVVRRSPLHHCEEQSGRGACKAERLRIGRRNDVCHMSCLPPFPSPPLRVTVERGACKAERLRIGRCDVSVPRSVWSSSNTKPVRVRISDVQVDTPAFPHLMPRDQVNKTSNNARSFDSGSSTADRSIDRSRSRVRDAAALDRSVVGARDNTAATTTTTTTRALAVVRDAPLLLS